MTIQCKNEALQAFLKKNNYETQIQPETRQVYAVLKVSGKEFPLFIRVLDDSFLLQLLVFIPCELKPQYLPDVARLLHLMNKELDLPGFGMDEQAGAIFYRLMIPTPKKHVEEDLLRAFLQTMERVCTLFAHSIAAVAVGIASLEEILKKAKDLGTHQKP